MTEPTRTTGMLRPLLVALTLVFATGCDSGLGEAQRLFEDEAFLGVAAGYTEVRVTDDRGAVVIDTDVDDWRVGPTFGTRIQVLAPPSPNPVGRDGLITFQLFTTEAGEISLRRRNARGDLLFVEAFSSTSGGIRTVTVRGSEVSDGTEALNRLLVVDGRGRVVTYGDVLVVG